MTESILLRGAMSFLILCNNNHGPDFCRALIIVVNEHDSLSNFNGDGWGG